MPPDPGVLLLNDIHLKALCGKTSLRIMTSHLLNVKDSKTVKGEGLSSHVVSPVILIVDSTARLDSI